MGCFFFCLFPDHWHRDPSPFFARVEVIRVAIDTSNTLSYRKDFIPVLMSLGLQPKIALPNLLSKVKRKTAKAEKTGDWKQLCFEMTDLTGRKKEIIGPICEANGVTPQKLHDETPLSDSITITNHVVAELYRRTKSIPWKTVLETWWPLLFPEKDIPSSGTVISSWESVAKKKALLSRDSMANKEDFLNAKLCFIPILLENFMQVFTHTFCCS